LNRLKDERSPYLLQHASNPVDWYPWGDEAFGEARARDKPVFLSIGYSTCHWCHVMEAECFDDPEVAALMNDAFVSVKVDREERPDLDGRYMEVCQLLTGSGGWPLSIVMTPEKEPFFAATYIPKTGGYGRPGMLELVPRISELWKTSRSRLTDSARAIARELARPAEPAAAREALLAPGFLSNVAARISSLHDEEHGGFGGAPKFPMPDILLFLLRSWKSSGDPKSLAIVEKSLTAMRNGGIYDQLGFGFHRYSTDSRWLVPHFEKMLYDQALLALAYTEAWQATGKAFYRATAEEILRYVRRDMTDPGGGFASAEDADSEGEEGRFYLWKASEARGLLTEAEFAEFSRRYRVREEGNFAMPGDQASGMNILHRDPSDTSPPGAIEEKLLAARARRPRPFRDDKILAGWNGLAIAAFARAGGAFDEPALREAASNAALFVLSRMRARDGSLMHRYRNGESGIPAFADDYAYLAWGLLELYEATFTASFLEQAAGLVDSLVARFWDPNRGGFFLTDNFERASSTGRKPLADGVLPSANSVALLVLAKLGRLMDNKSYRDKAGGILGLYPARALDESPSSFCFFFSALDFISGPPIEVAVAGDPLREDTGLMARALRRAFSPGKTVVFRPPGAEPDIVRLAPFARYQTEINGRATAYVCRGGACSLPTNDVSQMMSYLGAKGH
jgi:uncharacterized protein YyaL (SSP411 family)